MDVTRSHSLSIGIVGLPNSGKSTLFNSLTKNCIPAENYPFCTIDKNVGVVEIQDERLKKLSEFYDAQKIIPGAIKFVDIAGLVEGASKGEGLGNKFLAHIREVDVILYVLRSFESDSIVHVYNRVDPFGDFEIVQSELIFKDIEVLERYMKDEKKEGEFAEVLEFLNKGIPIVEMDLDRKVLELLKPLSLLTQKQRIFLLNTNIDLDEDFHFSDKVRQEDRDFVLKMDVKSLGELESMSEDEKREYLTMVEGNISTLDDLIQLVCSKLNLITFYTGNEKECNAWSIVEGSNVKEAAGVIHTDLQRGFVTADTINVEKLIDVGGWVKAKELGLVKNHAKEYIVQDGDYIVILANF
jgi:ribosome-binding ATPase